jgi:hypothetical protein
MDMYLPSGVADGKRGQGKTGMLDWATFLVALTVGTGWWRMVFSFNRSSHLPWYSS